MGPHFVVTMKDGSVRQSTALLLDEGCIVFDQEPMVPAASVDAIEIVTFDAVESAPTLPVIVGGGTPGLDPEL